MKKLFLVCLLLVSAVLLSGCNFMNNNNGGDDEKNLQTFEGENAEKVVAEQLNNVAKTTVKNVNQISVKFDGRIEASMMNEEGQLEDQNMTVHLDAALVLDDQRVPQAASAVATLLDHNNEGLEFEAYLKEGKFYGYAKASGLGLFASDAEADYGYEDDLTIPPLEVEDADIDEIFEGLDEYLKLLPAPVVTFNEKNAEFTVVYECNDANLEAWVNSIAALSGANDGQITVEQVRTMLTINQVKLTLVLTSGKLTGFKLDVDVVAKDEFVAMAGFGKVKTNIDLKIAYENVSPKFDSARLAEIKAGYEAQQSEHEDHSYEDNSSEE